MISIQGETMGLFGFIKSVRNEMKKLDTYKKMTVEELKELSDDDLRSALSERLIAEEDRNAWEVRECLSSFKGAKKIYYIVNYFDMEVQNGGLCQFFVNSSRDVAPYVVESLNAIGAINYKILLNDFVEEHNINLSDLDSFMIEDVEEFEAQTKRYPFDDFDDKYYELYEKEPLEDLLISYAKKHLEDFKMD